jgi:hypothetical protein
LVLPYFGLTILVIHNVCQSREASSGLGLVLSPIRVCKESCHKIVVLSGSEYVLSYPKRHIFLNFIEKLIFTIKEQHRIYPALCLHLPHLSAATVPATF